LWAGSHDRELGDVLALQQQIAQEVARTIHARLTPEEEQRLANARRVIPEAYECYVKGRHFWNKRTEPDFDRSIEHFNRAAGLDPGYAAPYVGLADAHIMLGIFGLRSPRDLYTRAKAAAETALSLDETLGEAHKSLAALRFFYEWDPRGAEWHCHRAIELDPNSATSHQWYGIILACLRRHEEAIGEMKRARDLDPLSIPIYGLLALSYIHARRYGEAIQASRAAVELDANNPFGHWHLARSLDANNELGEALAEAELACSLSSGRAPYRPYLGYMYGRTGDRLRAREVLRHLEEYQRTKYVSPHDIGLIYTALGERDLAFEWLEKAFAERTFRICELFNPAFDSLRGDARFQDLARRLGIWSENVFGWPDVDPSVKTQYTAD
jgi:tetratricopeptide (TPR) repeat protein